MKARKMLLMMVAVCSVVALLSVNAHAAWKWYTCDVADAGPAGRNVYTTLTDTGPEPDFQGERFLVWATAKKEILATLLTAMNMGVQVEAKINYDLATPYVKGVKLLLTPTGAGP